MAVCVRAGEEGVPGRAGAAEEEPLYFPAPAAVQML